MQGLGRHSEADITLLIDEDLAALSQMLGDKEYLLGRHPCLADASAFGFLDKCVTARVSYTMSKAHPSTNLHNRRTSHACCRASIARSMTLTKHWIVTLTAFWQILAQSAQQPVANAK